ncbi:MAG TPA: cyclophilin-like fold protein [Nitrosopumilaceae archaeon]|nr:cyclophilin-like fold protein [Nitrosopumilaceae archaeon]
MSTSSVSKINLILEIRGKTKITCELKKHLSPRTVGIIIRSLPLEGNAHLLGKSITYLETPIESGIERPRKEFKKGDIAFMPTSGSICFFFMDSDPGKTMTPIGKVTSNVDELKNIKPGDIFSLYAETG